MAGVGSFKSSAVFTSAGTWNIRSSSGTFANLAKRDTERKLVPSGDSSMAGTTSPKVAAHVSKSSIPAEANKSGRR